MDDSPNWRLKLAVWQSGRTQIRLARAVGRSDAWFSRVVNGLTEPSTEEQARIAEILGKSEDELFAGEM